VSGYYGMALSCHHIIVHVYNMLFNLLSTRVLLSAFQITINWHNFSSFTAPPSSAQNVNPIVRRNTTVVVGWDHPLSNGGRNDIYYDVKYRKVSSTGPFAPAGQTSESPFTVQGLKPVTQYYIRITAENGVSDQEAGSQDERTTEIVVDTREGSKLSHR